MRNTSVMPSEASQNQTRLRKAITFLVGCVAVVFFVDAAYDFHQGFQAAQAKCQANCPK